MLTYNLSRSGGIPLYEQLYRAIRKDLLAGVIRGGEKLPSKRLLAEHLSVSRITVETAYQQLQDEGWITAKERSGYFAEMILPDRTNSPVTEKRSENITVPDAAAQQFPTSVWAKLTRRVLTENRDLLLSPLPGAGVYQLRTAIAAELQRSRGLNVSPDCILIGSGTEHFYNILIQLLGRDLIYGLETPGHTKIAAVCKANGVEVHPLPVDEAGISVDVLTEARPDVVYLSPSHQFPTGCITPIRRRQQLLLWADAQPGRWLIEDDYDAEFRFSGKPLPAMAELDHSGHVIYLNTFTKTLTPSLRISYMVLPSQLMQKYREQLGFYSCSVPALEQLTLALFFSEGHFERHLNRMRKHYRNLLRQLTSGLEESCGSRISLFYGDGLHFVMHAPTAPEDLPKLLSVGGLSVSRIADYDLPPFCTADRNSFVLDYTALDSSAIPAICSLLSGSL